FTLTNHGFAVDNFGLDNCDFYLGQTVTINTANLFSSATTFYCPVIINNSSSQGFVVKSDGGDFFNSITLNGVNNQFSSFNCNGSSVIVSLTINGTHATYSSSY